LLHTVNHNGNAQQDIIDFPFTKKASSIAITYTSQLIKDVEEGMIQGSDHSRPMQLLLPWRLRKIKMDKEIGRRSGK